MNARRTWMLWAPFALAGVLLTIWWFVWSAGAGAMRSALADFAADERADGGEVSYAPMRARGFPFFLRGEADAFSIARGKYRLQSETVYLHASPFDLRRIVFSTAPALQLSTPSGVWMIRAEALRASIEEADAAWLFKAEAASLEGVNGASAFKTGRGVINVAPDAEDAFRITFRLLDAGLETARGRTGLARLDAALTARTGPLRLQIHGLDSEIGAGRVGVSGSVGVDASGFLSGRLDASIENPAPLTEMLRVTGALKPGDARNVEAGLGLLAAAGGGRVSAPLAFEDGETKLAGIRIAKAPRVGQP